MAVQNPQKLVATVSRREGVYNRTGEPSVIFAVCGQPQGLSLRYDIFFNPCEAPTSFHSSLFTLLCPIGLMSLLLRKRWTMSSILRLDLFLFFNFSSNSVLI